MLILVIVLGLAIAAVAQTGARGSAALAAVTPVQGTDVSSLQGASTSINWTSVAGSERFVAVKATEGNYYTDPDYRADVTAAAAAGLYVMPYVFANPYGSNASNVNAGNGWGSVQADYAWNQESTRSPPPPTSPAPCCCRSRSTSRTTPTSTLRPTATRATG